jgi:uncharacterized protein with von Willebrand factor type A (vWA) domain
MSDDRVLRGTAEVLDDVGRELEQLEQVRTQPRRLDADAERVGRGLAQLVLTLVDLLRELMERQALRRIEGGSLSDDEIERLGLAFKALSERMEELKEAFELEDEDLNLHLGPLGDLR